MAAGEVDFADRESASAAKGGLSVCRAVHHAGRFRCVGARVVARLTRSDAAMTMRPDVTLISNGYAVSGSRSATAPTLIEGGHSIQCPLAIWDHLKLMPNFVNHYLILRVGRYVAPIRTCTYADGVPVAERQSSAEAIDPVHEYS